MHINELNLDNKINMLFLLFFLLEAFECIGFNLLQIHAHSNYTETSFIRNSLTALGINRFIQSGIIKQEI